MDVVASGHSDEKLLTELYDKIIQFPQALPGFQDSKQFVLARTDNQEAPFFTLRSISDARIGVTVVEPHVLVPDYSVIVDDVDMIPIASPTPAHTGILVVVIIEPLDKKKIKVRANLRSPIVINKELKLACQVNIKNPPPSYTDSVVFEY